MNYSKNTKIRFKKAVLLWVGLIVVGFILGIYSPAEKADAEEYFFEVKVQEPEPIEQISLGEYTISAYCPCEICCGKWAKNRPNGIVYGAYQTQLIEGISVAAAMPEGTEIFIDGVGQFTVQDKLADWVLEKYDNQIIDVYFENHEDAKKFGLQKREIFILKGVENFD